MTIEEAWASIESRLVAIHEKPASEMLLPPVAEDDICDLEKALGCKLPDEYKNSLRVHEAGVYWLWFWDAVALNDLSYVLESYRENVAAIGPRSADSAAGIRAEGFVNASVFDRKWVPIANDNGIPICLDLNPPSGGNYGQVIYVDWEDGTVRVIADGFLSFLKNGLQKMPS